MSSEKFNVTEHAVPGCHIREYPGSTVHKEDILKLHVKQYTPKNQAEPVPADAITIIAAHGAALPKGLYEPLWDELLNQATGFHIRSIWVADCASMNTSGVLNEDKLSMDCSWMDHARDLFLMINHFREQMPRPLVGIGHSMGGNIITNLAFLHPRLFTTILLVDPVIQLSPPAMGFGTDPPGAANYTLRRSDVWPSREAAVQANRQFMHGWDPRCVELMAEHGFRDLPTRLYPDVEAVKAKFGTSTTDNNNTTPVTLTTTKHHDLLGQIRQNFSARKPTTGVIEISRDSHADLDPVAAFIPLYRPEPRSTFFRLPTLRPSCLWVVGGSTYLNLDEMRLAIKRCGTGVGGSGGLPEGRVKEVTLPGLGHLMPFQEVKAVVEPCAAWLREEMERFSRVEREWEEAQKGKSHLVVEDNWYKVLKPVNARRGKGGPSAKLS
ncbi:toxin biosynthesis protein-like protein [Aspergillus costaricaensis CBS 115574]|uniref:Toxin biosynthesis protein-like protein n=1 Tax=Aspergillus costaricaensis CBS 115574 TaxID=1448317 RepID=A0ACD1IH80_9EURO|nr:toxin biosynthesis protein-like protein [Aspergillus costaricaensis CBS 115574]RAK89385.1 toxin biosynthesis protein-like protein [Aspergillus costaricaensis CBS 115574]